MTLFIVPGILLFENLIKGEVYRTFKIYILFEYVETQKLHYTNKGKINVSLITTGEELFIFHVIFQDEEIKN